MTENPYQSPRETGYEPPQARPARRQSRLLLLVVPVLIGAMAGVVFARLFAENPHDPRVEPITAGMGGFLGLAAGILLRIRAWLLDL